MVNKKLIRLNISCWLLLLSFVLPAVCFDYLEIKNRDVFKKVRTIQINDLDSTTEFNGIEDQQTYIQLFTKLLSQGISSINGINLIKEGSSTEKPDMIIQGKFLVLDNGDAEKRKKAGIFGLTSSKCKVEIKAVDPSDETEIFSLEHSRSALKGKYEDELVYYISEITGDITKFISENISISGAIQDMVSQITCKDIKNKSICYIASLCTEENKFISDIIDVELINYLMKKRIKINKLDFTIDTLFQSIYRSSLADKEIHSLPEDVLSKVQASNIDYLFIVYELKGVRSGQTIVSKHPKMEIIGTSSGGSHSVPKGTGFSTSRVPMAVPKGVVSSSNINKFLNVFCRISFIDVKNNTAVISRNISTDSAGCRSKKVDCMVKKILKSICEIDKKDNTCTSCLKIR